MPPPRARALVAAAVLGGLATGGVTSAATADAAGHPARRDRPADRCPADRTDLGRGWQALRPTFRAGPAAVRVVVTSSYAPDRIVATNGVAVATTVDAGCHWSSYVPPPRTGTGLLPQPADGAVSVPGTAAVTALAAPSSATVSDRIYAGITDTSVLGSRPRVAAFDGDRWRDSATGLPAFGRLAAVAASESAPTVAYVIVDGGGALGAPGLYVSSDGGVTWTLANAAVTSSGYRDLAVDPIIPTRLYARTDRGVVVSANGGRTFSAPLHPAGDVASVSVASVAGSVLVVQGHRQQRRYDVSGDFGRAWSSAPAPVRTVEVAAQPLFGDVAVSDGHALWLQRTTERRPARNLTPPGGPPDQLGLTAPTARGFAVVGRRGGLVLRAVLGLGGRVLPTRGGVPVELVPHAAPHAFPASLLPGTRSVVLAAGRHRDVPYRLLLPRTPAPIDVMFLVDSTDSMQPTIDGLKGDIARIVDQLGAAGLDVQFGLADFRDYASSVRNRGGGDATDYPYRLDRRIGPVTAALQRRLAGLHANGGGDPPEAQLTALYQSTTGAGQRYLTHPHGRRVVHQVIPAGLEAGYRPGSLRLAVLATDAEFHKNPHYLTPTWARTVQALRAAGVHQIGLAVQTVADGRPEGFDSRHDEAAMALATGTVAPAGGVDCNGDLVPDVPAGSAFVCPVPAVITRSASVGPVQTPDAKVQPVELTSAITTAAEQISDVHRIAMLVHGAPRGVARVVAPVVAPAADLKVDNRLGYTVRFSCPRVHRAQRYTVAVGVSDGLRTLASATTSLRCLPAPAHHAAPPRPLPPVRDVAAAAAPAAAAGGAPPAPGQPVPNANPNPNPNPAANANVGVAGAEEEQPQLAVAGADVDPGGSGGLAMSALFVGAAALLTGAAAYAARARAATASQRS